jgi:hypothetical protein
MATPCVLTPIPNTVNRFTAKPGALKLALQQVNGRTDLDCVNSKVSEISDIANPVAVTHDCDQASFGFQMDNHKKYFIALTFVQLLDPFHSVANLNDAACGKKIDTIDVTNLFPGYVITVEA